MLALYLIQSHHIYCLAWEWFIGKNHRSCLCLLSLLHSHSIPRKPSNPVRNPKPQHQCPVSSPEPQFLPVGRTIQLPLLRKTARCLLWPWVAWLREETGLAMFSLLCRMCSTVGLLCFLFWIKTSRLYLMTPLTTFCLWCSLVKATSPVWCKLKLWDFSSMLLLVRRWTFFHHTERNLYLHSLWIVSLVI